MRVAANVAALAAGRIPVVGALNVVLGARRRFERANRRARGPRRFWLKLRDGFIRPMVGL